MGRETCCPDQLFYAPFLIMKIASQYCRRLGAIGTSPCGRGRVAKNAFQHLLSLDIVAMSFINFMALGR
jgi:hypothetical protein